MIEKTLVLLKPDAVQRGLAGEILQRFEKAGLKIVGLKMVKATPELAKTHYTDALIPIVGGKTMKDWESWGFKGKESKEEIGAIIVNSIRNMLTNHPFIALVLEGIHAVEIARKIVGPTGPKDAPPGTIRGDFGHSSLGYASVNKKGISNLIHASGNIEEANREIAIWFSKQELFSYSTVHDNLVLQTHTW